MDNSQDIVRSIIKIWIMCKKQETMLKHAMCLEGSLQLRKTFCLSYIISLVFRNELSTAYDELKCNLTDPDLNDLFDQKALFLLAEELSDGRAVAQHLNEINLQCKSLTCQVDLRDCEKKIISEFVCISQDLTDEMDKHLGRIKTVPVQKGSKTVRSADCPNLIKAFQSVLF